MTKPAPIAPPLVGLGALPEGIALAHFRLRILDALRGFRPAAPEAALSPIADQVLAAAHDELADEVLEAIADEPPAMADNDADPIQAELADPVSTASQLALLRRIAAARYGAYRTETGFIIGGGGGPNIHPETVDALLRGGWIWEDPTGGRLGSVKVSADGRERLGTAARFAGGEMRGAAS